MASVYEQTHQEEYLDIAKKAAQYIQNIADYSEDGEAALVKYNDTYLTDLYYLGVCQGPIGTSRLFYKLYRITGDESYKDFVIKLTNGLLAAGAPTKHSDGYWRTNCYCCGAAGMLEHFLHVHKLTGNSVYLDAAYEAAEAIIGPYLNNTKGVNLTLAISPTALLLSAIIAVITVLISASIPARKAVQLTAIDALRENHDIRIRSRKIRSPKWIYQVFGFEGMLANKNFKRNRRKYRLTVFSLAISVILFIGSASFNGYMTRSVDMSLQEMTADITLSVSNDDMNHQSAEKSYQKMRSLRAVDDASYSKSAMNTYVILDKEQIDTSYYRFNKSGNNQNENTGFHAKNAGDKVILPVQLSFINDSSYQKYLEEHHLNVSKYMDTKKLCPLIWDNAGKTRLRKVAKECVNYGQRVQNSVFECLLDASQALLLKKHLLELIDLEKDSLRFYYIGNNYRDKIEYYGAKTSYDPEGLLMI